MGKATFWRCPKCGRLNIKDSNNPEPKCTEDCERLN